MDEYSIRMKVLDEALPCKVHHVKPHWEEVIPNAMNNALLGPQSKQYKLICMQCEWEKVKANYQPKISQWNKEQEK